MLESWQRFELRYHLMFQSVRYSSDFFVQQKIVSVFVLYCWQRTLIVFLDTYPVLPVVSHCAIDNNKQLSLIWLCNQFLRYWYGKTWYVIALSCSADRQANSQTQNGWNNPCKFHYTGTPFYRQGSLQSILGVSITAAMIFDQTEYVANALHYYINDTTHRILDQTSVIKKQRNSDKEWVRTGLQLGHDSNHRGKPKNSVVRN